MVELKKGFNDLSKILDQSLLSMHFFMIKL
jgi:hypothetical protein